MPRRELKYPSQITQWLNDWGNQITAPSSMILIGSAGLLWHIARIGLEEPLPENSMDADPVTDSEAVAELAYDAMIGSRFEAEHGWHVNLMPRMVLDRLPTDWQNRAYRQQYQLLEVVVPAPLDLLAPKLTRNEPRDRQHAELAKRLGLI